MQVTKKAPQPTASDQVRTPSTKRRVLLFADYYLPGFRGGGPLRSIANLIDAVNDEFDFFIVTRDRDLTAHSPFTGIRRGTWERVGAAQVCYLSPLATNPVTILRIMRAVKHDLLYLNSFFSPRFSLTPLLLSRLVARSTGILIAPRGELFPGALLVKRRRKELFLSLVRRLKLYSRVVFHASSDEEKAVILEAFGSERVLVSPVLVAPDLAVTNDVSSARMPKRSGVLRLVTVARIARNKNIAGAIKTLGRLEGEVSLELFGPREDPVYWAECLAAMNRLPANVVVSYGGVLPAAEAASRIGTYDAFFLLTHGENFGHAIVEALSAGCPVVLSDRTPWKGLEESAAGWAIPLSAQNKCEEVLSALMLMDEEQHSFYRARARAYAESIINDASAIDENRVLLRSAIASKPGQCARPHAAVSDSVGRTSE